MRIRSLSSLPLFVVTVASAALLACSSSSSPPAQTTADSGADVTADVTTDTTPSDTAADTAPNTCPAPLPSGYACPAPKKPATSTTCTAADVQGYWDACFGQNSSDTTCTAFTASVQSCGDCLKGGWIRPDLVPNAAACMLTIDSTATDCANADECDDDCTNVTCWNQGICADSTAASDCNAQVVGAGGACYTVANEEKLTTCRGDARFAACDWTQFASDADFVHFLAGACQFGGDWNATAPSDAGTDSASETSTDASDETSTDAASAG